MYARRNKNLGLKYDNRRRRAENVSRGSSVRVLRKIDVSRFPPGNFRLKLFKYAKFKHGFEIFVAEFR